VPNRDAESCHGTMPRCNTAKVVSTRDRSIKQKFWGLHGTPSALLLGLVGRNPPVVALKAGNMVAFSDT